MDLPRRFGRYELIEKIACGGTAEVYHALLDSGGGFTKSVAIKRLLPSLEANEELRAMLVDEGRVLCRLPHQSIVQLFELGSGGGLPFLAMEYVDGIDCGRLLTRCIREKAPLPAGHAFYIISQILTALEFAHRCTDEQGNALGIVHRDISPSNILLSWNGEVKLTDFGIAKGSHRSNHTLAGQVRGKYSYMAPEQARGENIDARADLFACGIVLYEMLTALRMYDAHTEIEALKKAAAAEFELGPIERLAPEIRALLMLALAADPKSRYKNAAEMLKDVRTAARASGEMSSSLDMAQFLRAAFPGPTECQLQRDKRPHQSKIGTRVLGPCFLPAEQGGPDFRRGAARVAKSVRTAGFAVMFAACTMLPSARGDVAASNASTEKVVARSQSAAVTLPPKQQGSIAIDSVPGNARGFLTIGGARREVTTPFALSGIDIEKPIAGRIELLADGYVPLSETFALTSASNAFVKEYRLKRTGNSFISVSARPWGIASIAGYVDGRETPLTSIKVKSGAHLVRVTHPPSGNTLTARIALADGESKRCFATFVDKPSLSCR